MYDRVHVIFTTSKNTAAVNCEYDSVVGVFLPVENKIVPIVHLKLKVTKTHSFFYFFCQKYSGCVFAKGKNGSAPL